MTENVYINSVKNEQKTRKKQPINKHTVLMYQVHQNTWFNASVWILET